MMSSRSPLAVHDVFHHLLCCGVAPTRAHPRCTQAPAGQEWNAAETEDLCDLRPMSAVAVAVPSDMWRAAWDISLLPAKTNEPLAPMTKLFLSACSCLWFECSSAMLQAFLPATGHRDNLAWLLDTWQFVCAVWVRRDPAAACCPRPLSFLGPWSVSLVRNTTSTRHSCVGCTGGVSMRSFIL